MSLTYCYSTKSKRISIEAMLQLYKYEYGIFNWKPKICVAEKRLGRWDIYYDIASIENAQILCKEIFEDNLKFKTLHDEICGILNEYEHFTNEILKNGKSPFGEMTTKYFDLYRRLLHLYGFSNEFCFNNIENDIINELSSKTGNNLATEILMQKTDMRDTYSKKAYDDLNVLRNEYLENHYISDDKINSYIEKYDFLYNKSKKTNKDAIIKELSRSQFDIIENTPQHDENLKNAYQHIEEKDKRKIDKVFLLREVRLKMRENMMRGNYYFTNALRNKMKEHVEVVLSNNEIENLLRILSIENILNISKTNVLNILRNQINVLLYISNEVLEVNREFDFRREKENIQIVDEDVFCGKTVYGKGNIEGVVKTCYSNTGYPDEYIYVTKSLHPKDILLLTGIKAIVVDEGGILSHASIMAKEIGIPCIVGTRKASRALYDGDRVLLNFDEGTVLRTDYKCQSTNGIYKMDQNIKDNERFGNKCVNLCRAADNFLVVDGYVIERDCVNNLYNLFIDGDGHVPREIKKITEKMYPVILRSSSIYEDREEATAAGLLESKEAIDNDEKFIEAIIDICESSKSKSLQIYLEKSGLDDNVFPSIIIQKYLEFDWHGTALINDSEIIIEIKGKDGKLDEHVVPKSKCKAICKEPMKTIIAELSKIENSDVLIEFGIENAIFYLLQIRTFGGKKNV